MKAPCLLCVAAIASAAVLSAHDAHAQTAQVWPARPIRLVLPFPPGGATDTNARVIAREMEPVLGQPLVFDNRAGANSIVGCDIVAKAAADGYTIMYISVAFAINPSTHKKLPFDTARDFTPITNPIVGQGSLLALNPSVPAKSVAELIALGKTKDLTYATPGAGSIAHLATELFARTAGFRVTHISYRGVAPALTDVLRGEVTMMFAQLSTAKPLIESGELRVLGIASAARSEALPNVPTIAEAGNMPGFEAVSWYALMAPAGTSDAIVAKLRDGVLRAINAPEAKAALEAQGARPVVGTPAELLTVIAADTARWGKVIRDADIKLAP